MKTGSKAHKWQFKARFRRHAFGWKPQPAIKRVREAVTEIRKAARKDKLLAAEGAVSFLERVSPALEHVDSSSGAIGTAVNRAVIDLVEIIASAPADANTRGVWLERLFAAHAEDRIPYIERLADCWGGLCASPELGDRLGEDTAKIREWHEQTDRALREKLWHEEHGAFDVYDLRANVRLDKLTASGFMPPSESGPNPRGKDRRKNRLNSGNTGCGRRLHPVFLLEASAPRAG